MMGDRTEDLIAAALQVQKAAYAPYSGHPVGAALLTEDGRIFSGCNVENAAFPSGICAEASAIAAMVTGGGRTIAHLVIAGPGEHLCNPCGGCRQRIHEFAAFHGSRVTICSVTGTVLLQTSSEELLPHPFGPECVPLKEEEE